MKHTPDHLGSSVGLPVSNGYRIVRYGDIVRCEAAGNYTRFFLSDGKEIPICLRLKSVEAMLPKEVFCRAHRSHLVNLGWVEMWVRGNNGVLKMKDGTTIPVARVRKNTVKEILNI